MLYNYCNYTGSYSLRKVIATALFFLRNEHRTQNPEYISVGADLGSEMWEGDVALDRWDTPTLTREFYPLNLWKCTELYSICMKFSIQSSAGTHLAETNESTNTFDTQRQAGIQIVWRSTWRLWCNGIGCRIFLFIISSLLSIVWRRYNEGDKLFPHTPDIYGVASSEFCIAPSRSTNSRWHSRQIGHKISLLLSHTASSWISLL